MDRNLILEFAKKDVDELQLLVEAMSKNPDPDNILLEITIARAQTLIRELNLLRIGHSEQPDADSHKGTYTITEPRHVILEEKELELNAELPNTVPDRAIEFAKEPDHSAFVEVPVENEDKVQAVAKDVFVDPSVPVEDKRELRVENIENVQYESIDNIPIETSVAIEPGNIETPKVIETDNQPEAKVEPDQQEKEENEIKKPRLLGENFTKEPSLNERLTSQKEIQPKIKGKPVTCIKAAIGLNDRFMYTRELFDNNPSKFESTVEQLDKFTGIIEAIEFLEQNFKWPKSETSLKFVELVKQRFQK